MNTNEDSVDYKNNPDLFIEKLRNIPSEIEKECESVQFKMCSKENVKELTTKFQSTIDHFIDGHFKDVAKQVHELVKMEDSAESKEPLDRPNFDDCKLAGLEEKYLLEKRNRLKSQLEEAIKESKDTENEFKTVMQKYQKNP